MKFPVTAAIAAFFLSMAFSSSAVCATSSVSQPNDAESPTAIHSEALADAVKAYEAEKNPAHWRAVLAGVRDLIDNPAAIKTPAAALIKANPPLTDLHARLIDGGSLRIVTFTDPPEAEIIVQWRNVLPGKTTIVKAGRHKRTVHGAPTVKVTTQTIDLPAGISLRDGRLLHAVTATQKAPTQIATGTPILVLVGTNKAGTAWLHGYKPGGATWQAAPEIFAGVPAYFIQDLLARPSFSGNDLVLSTGDAAAGGANNGYRLVLHFTGAKYIVAGQTDAAGPLTVLEQFVEALRQNRPEIAKGWLSDAKLIAIPKYLNLFGCQSLKIMPMQPPPSGVSRFRLVTAADDDLIADVGKIKSQLLIKALFIAPRE